MELNLIPIPIWQRFQSDKNSLVNGRCDEFSRDFLAARRREKNVFVGNGRYRNHRQVHTRPDVSQVAKVPDVIEQLYKLGAFAVQV